MNGLTGWYKMAAFFTFIAIMASVITTVLFVVQCNVLAYIGLTAMSADHVLSQRPHIAACRSLPLSVPVYPTPLSL